MRRSRCPVWVIGRRRDLSRQSLAEVVEPRYDELFTLDSVGTRRSGYEELIPAGVVLTGGTSKMEGAVDLLRRSSICRSESARLNTRGACTTLSAILFMPPRWGCCFTARKKLAMLRGSAGSESEGDGFCRARQRVVRATFLAGFFCRARGLELF